MTKCNQHFKRVNVVVKPDFSLPYDSVVPIHGYTMLRPGSSRVSVGLRNLCCQKITIQAKSVIAKVTAANVILHSLAPNINQEQLKENPEQKNSKTNNRVEIPPLTPEKEKLAFYGFPNSWQQDIIRVAGLI